jgi:hypothetical protein
MKYSHGKNLFAKSLWCNLTLTWFIEGVNIYIKSWSWLVDIAFLILATFKLIKYQKISGLKKSHVLRRK